MSTTEERPHRTRARRLVGQVVSATTIAALMATAALAASPVAAAEPTPQLTFPVACTESPALAVSAVWTSQRTGDAWYSADRMVAARVSWSGRPWCYGYHFASYDGGKTWNYIVPQATYAGTQTIVATYQSANDGVFGTNWGVGAGGSAWTVGFKSCLVMGGGGVPVGACSTPAFVGYANRLVIATGGPVVSIAPAPTTQLRVNVPTTFSGLVNGSPTTTGVASAAWCTGTAPCVPYGFAMPGPLTLTATPRSIGTLWVCLRVTDRSMRTSTACNGYTVAY